MVASRFLARRLAMVCAPTPLLLARYSLKTVVVEEAQAPGKKRVERRAPTPNCFLTRKPGNPTDLPYQNCPLGIVNARKKKTKNDKEQQRAWICCRRNLIFLRNAAMVVIVHTLKWHCAKITGKRTPAWGDDTRVRWSFTRCVVLEFLWTRCRWNFR